MSTISILLFLAVSAKSDMMFSVAALARQTHALKPHHERYLKRLLRYLTGTTKMGIMYRAHQPVNSQSLQAHVDADWGVARRLVSQPLDSLSASTAGYSSGRAIHKLSLLSTAEAEYVALSSFVKHVTWVRRLVWEVANKRPWMGSGNIPKTLVHMDSTAAMGLATNDQISARNKHIDVKVHHVRNLIRDAEICLQYIPLEVHIADMLTKALPFQSVEKLRSLMNITDLGDLQ